jgi:hypothetical protein
MTTAERITEDAMRVLYTLVSLELSAVVFGLTATLIGLLFAAPLLAWRWGLPPFRERPSR